MEFATLIQQPEAMRDDHWEAAFLSQLTRMKVRLESDQAKQGPDGWPYFLVRTGGEEPVTDIIEWLATRGIGLAVNAHKMLPDYIFPYGMLWNFVETGQFARAQVGPRADGTVLYSEDNKLIYGPPSEQYLPLYVRAVIRDFLRGQGMVDPRILVVSTTDFKVVDLLFAVESLGHLPAAKHASMAEMLAWFLPFHYNLVIGSEKDLPKFYSL